VLQPVGRLDAPVDLGRRGYPEVAEGKQSRERGNREEAKQAKARPVGHDAEDAEPGQADVEADGNEEGEDQWPAAFHHHRCPDGATRAGKPARQLFSAMGGFPSGHPLPSGAPSRRLTFENSSKRGEGEASAKS
jgi:hypothetical protein